MMNILPPARKGTYLMIVCLPWPTRLQVGKLGIFDLPAGHYAYAGSALGPGGLAARLARHQDSGRPCHWHIDYLLRAGVLKEAWYVESSLRLECTWTHAVAALPDAFRPIPRFGASDCRCPAHLIGLSPVPDNASLQMALADTLSAASLRLWRWVFDLQPDR